MLPIQHFYEWIKLYNEKWKFPTAAFHPQSHVLMYDKKYFLTYLICKPDKFNYVSSERIRTIHGKTVLKNRRVDRRTLHENNDALWIFARNDIKVTSDYNEYKWDIC